MLRKLLIANRAEVAIRISRTAADLGIATVGIHTTDDAVSLHVRSVDAVVALSGTGPAGYLDADDVVRAATSSGCDSVHPGYGFLAENAGFARACTEAGMTFVGPSPAVLDLFGDKVRARDLAASVGVPVLRAASVDDAAGLLGSLGDGGAVMVKAVAGGGGRGLRPVSSIDDLPATFDRCASEAEAAFGNGALYVEELVPRARHVEVQVVGDGTGVSHLWDRECSLQQQRQKVVEVAPASMIEDGVRQAVLSAAVDVAAAAGLCGVGTVEFLVDETSGRFFFLEVNPRLQVEHTVTEEVLGLDLVAVQLALAGGATLASLGLAQQEVPAPRGVAVQCRVNLGPRTGTLTAYEPPSGPGVRVDGFGYSGYRTTGRYDALLAKVIAHSPRGGIEAAIAKASRALAEFRIEGAGTNLGFLRSLLADPSVRSGDVHTTFIEERLAEGPLLEVAERRYFSEPAPTALVTGRAGVRLETDDPLAVLHHGRRPDEAIEADEADDHQPAPEGTRPLLAPIQGTVVSVGVAAGEAVRAGQHVLVMESMKLEHVVVADVDGIVHGLTVAPGDTVLEGHAVAFLVASERTDAAASVDGEEDVDLDELRPDLAEAVARHRRTLDDARPDAVARRRRHGQRTARENVDDLCDPGSFVEYSPLTVAARRRRHSMEELIEQTPADGLVMGLGSVDGSPCAVMAYDYTVLAGTQGAHNHIKLDRLAELARRWRLPTVFFTEGGGGRPGDTEGGAGFIRGFELWAQLSGLVPLVGITSGRCFAGNAAVLGCCDVIIATKDSALGMGGPAMVEGGGLGVFRPEEIGPVDVMQRNGTIDVLVDDEAAAVAVAKQYLSYFVGASPEDWACEDQRLLRRVVPENRVRVYDVRRVISLLADRGSVLELRPRFGVAMITSLIRVEGRPMGVIANNPAHLGGAIDADASDKAARFMQLCEAFDLPVLSLSDTPGNMVGPEAEKTALIRHCSRMFLIGANLTVPIFSVILRKSYGLGAIAMTGGSYQAAMFCVAWPTGEFGGMGLEGSVKLGYRNELAAIADPVERKATFDRMVAAAYAAGKAIVRAAGPALDDVIDPADTRRWISAGLRSLPPVAPREGKKLPWIDAW